MLNGAENAYVQRVTNANWVLAVIGTAKRLKETNTCIQ
jgi:hypothetical protein